MEDILKQTEAYVKKLQQDETSGHDWHHTDRVRKLALYIALQEGADLFLTELGALLHEVGDYKLEQNRGSAETQISEWLSSLQTDKSTLHHVLFMVKNSSFSAALDKTPEELQALPLETKVLSDADKIDSMGAIGIARAFAFGGFKKQHLHIPGTEPRKNLTKATYQNSESTTINHFHEKLLKLKNMMLTSTGRQIAAERHQFMEKFLLRFYQEWEAHV